MTDLHTHILPGMDDGAKTVEDSLALLRMEMEQGVDTVVLTPHFYRDQERPEHFLARREASFGLLQQEICALPEGERESLPALIVGAEVAWRPNLSDWEELPRFCIGATKNLLLELPFTPWNDQMLHQIYDMVGRTGITPVIAHLERYLKIQRPELIRDVLSLDVPIQISSDIFLHPLTRGTGLKMLKRGQAHFLASDCHNLTTRKPNLATAMAVVEKKLGVECVQALNACASELTKSN